MLTSNFYYNTGATRVASRTQCSVDFKGWMASRISRIDSGLRRFQEHSE